MFSLTRIAAVAAALVALAAVPAVANAGSVPMRGVVSGSPYGASNGQMAIPVLFSRITARDTGLKSPVGVIIVKRTQKVTLPDKSKVLPVNLRTGDRFKGTGEVGSLQQRVFYPRVVFTKPVVYFRSKELSLAELSAAVDALRKALADLQAQFNALKASSIAAFNALLGQLNDLKNQLASLHIPAGVDLSTIQSQIDALNTKLNDLIAGLPDFAKFALLTDLASYAKLTDLTAALASYATKAYVDGAIAGLQTQIDALPTAQDVTDAVSGAITALNIGQYATTADVDSAVAGIQTQIDGVTGRLDSLCDAVAPIAGTLNGAALAAACPP